MCHLKATALPFQNKLVFTQTPPLRNPHTHPLPLLSGSPEPARPTNGGMRRDKLMVGLHQHMRLAKTSRVTDRHSSGAQGEWERPGTGLLRHGRLLICPQPACLMPTICVCNSSPTSQEPPQAHTQANNHTGRAMQLILYLAVLITDHQCHPKSKGQEPVCVCGGESRPCNCPIVNL